MNVQTIEADSMAAALKRVKRELGPEAVILTTRTVRRGGLFGFGGRQLVQVTASNEVNVVSRRGGRTGGAQQRQHTPVPRPRRPALQRAYGQAGATETGAPQPNAAAQTAPPADATSARAPMAGTNDPSLNEEIRQIRGMVHQMMRKQSGQPRKDLPDELFNQYLALLEQEVTEELAEQVVEQVRDRLGEKELKDPWQVQQAIGEALAEHIPADHDRERIARPTDGRPLTIALVGPTGVGKTTTLAKLAATFKLQEGKKVALVTIDTYRIAAVDQLRTYAGIINLPLHVVLTPQELRTALKRCEDCDVVLIDTAGRSQRNNEKLEDLQQFMEIAAPHETHLVLASNCGQKVLMDAVERFNRIRLDRVIFTKLDEAVSFGVLLNVARRVNKRLSYITTGQEVPHQIEPGRSDRLAKLILGEGL